MENLTNRNDSKENFENFTKWNASKKYWNLYIYYGYGIKAKWNDVTNAFHEPERHSGPFQALTFSVSH